MGDEMKRIAKIIVIIAGSYGIIFMLLYALRMWWMGYEYEMIDRAMRGDPYMHINDICRTDETMADPVIEKNAYQKWLEASEIAWKKRYEDWKKHHEDKENEAAAKDGLFEKYRIIDKYLVNKDMPDNSIGMIGSDGRVAMIKNIDGDVTSETWTGDFDKMLDDTIKEMGNEQT